MNGCYRSSGGQNHLCSSIRTFVFLSIRMITKSIVCIRHGESTFNAAWRKAQVDPLHFDAPLSEAGVEQVRLVRMTLARWPFELVITSPLTRALQTAAGLFDSHPSRPPLIVSALLRERVENSCDVGRSSSQLAADFPAFDFAHLQHPWWHVDEAPDARGICVEPVTVVETRVAEFRAYVLSRPEKLVAVVGHGTFLFHLTRRVLANCEIAEVRVG